MAVINFTKIAYTSPDLNRPGAGAEQWHSQNTVNIPSEGTNTQRLDVYWRFTWARIEKAKDQYDWSYLVNILNTAISKKQKVSFGIMSVYHDNEDGVINYDGGFSSYPLYLHQLMQAESVKDWKSSMSGGWVPNYNSQNYIGRLRALNVSLNNLLETGSNSGVKYKDIINSIDVRGYGNYGEWHNGGIVDTIDQVPGYPGGAHASTASLKAIIDAHTQALPNFQLSIIMTAFDANWLQHTKTSPEVAYYALTTKNNYGKLGWRRDNWGATDNYIRDLLVNNTRTWNGIALNTLIMPVYKYAPVTGEPMNTAPNEYGDFENQVRLYHAASFGNGNINQSVTTGVKDHIRAASKAAGYRIAVEQAEVTTSGKAVTIKMAWINEGRAPTYSNWDIVFLLVKSGAITELGKSTFKLRLFQPAGVATIAIDTLSKDVADGTYELRFKVVDPTNYVIPMPIFITAARGADGSYSLGNVTLSGGVIEPPVNKPPVVSAGPDREISFPTKTTTLVGSVSDTDGTIPADGITWAQIEGPVASTIVTPKSATTTVNFTKEGTYKYRITGKDDLGATSVDEAVVQVNPEIVPPVGKKVIGVRIDQATVIYDDQTNENFNPQ